MQDRRHFLNHAQRVALLLAASGALPGLAQAAYTPAAFDAKTLAEAVRALGGNAPTESRDVTLAGPDIAENGASVQLTLSTTLPSARKLLLLVDKNPALLSAVFEPSDSVDANFVTTVKMSQSSLVYAVAITADGKAFFAQRDIKVTLGGCGA